MIVSSANSPGLQLKIHNKHTVEEMVTFRSHILKFRCQTRGLPTVNVQIHSLPTLKRQNTKTATTFDSTYRTSVFVFFGHYAAIRFLSAALLPSVVVRVHCSLFSTSVVWFHKIATFRHKIRTLSKRNPPKQ